MNSGRQGFRTDVAAQLALLQTIVQESELIGPVLRRVTALGLPDWYVGAGSIAQTVWNRASGFDPLHGIKDLDLVYFDPTDLSRDSQSRQEARVREALSDLPVEIDVKNEAAVHLWYEDRFGYAIPPYTSCEDAIDSWPTTATSVGVTLRESRTAVYAPFGLNDLFGLIVRANKRQITEEIYLGKVRRWTTLWPALRVVPWAGA